MNTASVTIRLVLGGDRALSLTVDRKGLIQKGVLHVNGPGGVFECELPDDALRAASETFADDIHDHLNSEPIKYPPERVGYRALSPV